LIHSEPVTQPSGFSSAAQRLHRLGVAGLLEDQQEVVDGRREVARVRFAR
jgi:hypothetical protein